MIIRDGKILTTHEIEADFDAAFPPNTPATTEAIERLRWEAHDLGYRGEVDRANQMLSDIAILIAISQQVEVHVGP